MKKASAIILLLSLAALMVEAVTLPAKCGASAPVKCTMAAAMKGDCKKMMEKMAEHQQKKNKCNSQKCPDCPLCLLSTFKAQIAYMIASPVNKVEYAVMPDNFLTAFITRQWKPPNA